jgi:hypothetical protein
MRTVPTCSLTALHFAARSRLDEAAWEAAFAEGRP